MNLRHIFPVVYARSVGSILPTSSSKADALRQAVRRGILSARAYAAAPLACLALPAH
jgi:hypothetical protein